MSVFICSWNGCRQATSRRCKSCNYGICSYHAMVLSDHCPNCHRKPQAPGDDWYNVDLSLNSEAIQQHAASLKDRLMAKLYDEAHKAQKPVCFVCLTPKVVSDPVVYDERSEQWRWLCKEHLKLANLRAALHGGTWTGDFEPGQLTGKATYCTIQWGKITVKFVDGDEPRAKGA
jgi:hypothetical protein